jgi:cob(I)alamin adenosyltransferase
MKIYTKTGDDGNTGLLGNVRVGKETPRIEAYGAVDELNAAIGVVLAHLPQVLPASKQGHDWLSAIQSDLMIIGTMLATPPSDSKRHADLPSSRIQALETEIDEMESLLKPLKNFILPQGTPCCAFAHQARATSRRAERRVVALVRQERVDKAIVVYLNRLSDFLFVLARWVNMQEGGPELTWTYSETEGAKTTSEAAQPADRLGASLKKLETEKENRKTLFEKASHQIQKKKEIADKLFRQNVDQINKEGGKVEKPLRDFDLD